MSKYTQHFLYIDRALPIEWLFDVARRYWDRFRPIVVADLDIVAALSKDQTIVITTLARRDMAKQIAQQVKQRYPSARHDPLVYDYPAEAKLTLDGRAEYNQRFGTLDDSPLPSLPRTKR